MKNNLCYSVPCTEMISLLPLAQLVLESVLIIAAVKHEYD